MRTGRCPRLSARAAGLDPGLARWRVAWAATVSMGVALVAEYVLAPLPFPGHAALLAMLVGGVAAMQGSAAVLQPTARRRVRFALLQPVAAAVGLSASVLVRLVLGFPGELATFVVVTFFAVFIRRFGPPYAVVGLLGWAGYYIATVLRPDASELPFLLWAELIAGVCTGVLSLTVFRHRPRASLGHAIRGWHGQAERVFRDAARLLESPGRRRRGRLRARYRRLDDSALTVEGWLAHSVSAGSLHVTSVRHSLLESQTAIEVVVDAALALSQVPPEPSASSLGTERGLAIRVLLPLSCGDQDTAREEAHRVRDGGDACIGDHEELLRLGRAAVAFARAGRDWHASGVPAEDEALGRAEFTPVVAVGAAGALPGVTGTLAAKKSNRRGRGHSVSLPVRYAVQAAVAVGLSVVLGRMMFPEQYFWAPIAVFIVLLGPTTRAEALVKGVQRTVGTLLGCLAAGPITALLHGSPGPVICVVLVSCLLGHYLATVSYSYLAFFISISVFQLYGLMHQYNLSLVPIRLAETTLGAAIAVAVAALVLPVRSKDTVALARGGVFQAVGELLDELSRVRGARDMDGGQLPVRARTVDDRTRRLVAALRMRPSWTPSARATVRAEIDQHRLLTNRLRELSVAARGNGCVPSAAEAGEFRRLARFAHGFDGDGAPSTAVAPEPPVVDLQARVRHLVDALPRAETHGRPTAAGRAATLRGVITARDGRPLAGVVVIAVTPAGTRSERAHTGADGGYWLSTERIGPHLIIAMTPEHGPVSAWVCLHYHSPSRQNFGLRRHGS